MWAAAGALCCVMLAAWLAPRLARQLPPGLATVLLVGTAVATVVGSGYLLGALAFTWIAQIPQVAAEGDWSPLLLRNNNPVPAVLAVLGGAALAAGAVSTVRAARARLRSYRRMRRMVAGLEHDNGLLIVEAQRPEAYATPAGGGRIVISRGLLDALPPGEHRVVIAHERAHLALRHTWWIMAVDLAAAANPMLRPTAIAVAESVERWADERAAASVGDRRLAARALARAALHVHASEPDAALLMIGGQMPRRVNALLGPPPQRRLVPVVAWMVLLAAVTLTTLNVESHTDNLFDHAGVATRTGCSVHHRFVSSPVTPVTPVTPVAQGARTCGPANPAGPTATR